MTARFEDADDRDAPVESSTGLPERPARPTAVTVAAALLVVDGLVSIILTMDLLGRIGDQTPGIEPLALLTLAIGAATTLLGVLIHFGHAWLVTVNVAAVAGFLELMAGTPGGLITGAVDVAVVLLLVASRPWFTWSPDGEGDDEDDGEAGGAPSEDGGAA